MLHLEKIEQFYRDIERLTIKFPVATIAKATGYSHGNVSEYLRRKKEPSEAFLIAFYMWLNKQENALGESETESGSFKDKYISSLEEQNRLLKEQLNLATGQLRHLLLATQAKVDTNQNALADLLVKQKIVVASEVEDRLSKDNLKNYLKLKAEAGIA